jgi:MFS family permease
MSEPATDAFAVPKATILGLTARQRAGMLVTITLVAACSQVDRSIVGMVLEPIKHEFGLSDAQLGVTQGLAFAIAHAIVAVPLGFLADRTNRRNLIAACLVVWSVMTALCGFAGNFSQLLLARMGVGAGEAGGQSASLSVVSDLYTEKRRATAIAIFYLSSPIGAMLAGFLGGPITAAYGWRAALLIAGVPGLVMAVVLLLFGKEPPRESSSRAPDSRAAPSFGEVLRFIRGQPALLHLIVGLALITFTLSGIASFAVSFFIRYHGMTQREMGSILGLAGAATALVMLGSGLWADRLGRRDPRWRLWLIVPVEFAVTILLLIAYTAGGTLALPVFLAAYLLTQVWIGPGLATAQSLTPSRMRATSAAILYVIINLLGFGFGPVILGALSDAFAAHAGMDGLRRALIFVSLLNVWGALHVFLAARTLKTGLARATAAQ